MPASRKIIARPEKASARKKAEFALTFAKLRDILIPYQNRLEVAADSKYKYYTQTRSPSHTGKPLFFASVIFGRAFISYHLMPVYWAPSLLKGISPELKKCMHGKSCFNFTAPRPALFRELSRLTAKGLALYRSRNLL